MSNRSLVAALIAILLAPSAGLAHPGNTDPCGGHHNWAHLNGQYEIHRPAEYNRCKAEGKIGPNGVPYVNPGPGLMGEPWTLPVSPEPSPPTSPPEPETDPAGTSAPAIQIFVDGQLLNLDVAPRIRNGTTLVPLRPIFTALGASIAWDQATQTVTA